MGCDIHLYVEKRVDGQWRSVEEWKQEYEGEGLSVPYDSRFYTRRNYDLFAILADVGNGFGFAGVDTGDGFRPISSPKGLPEDVSTLLREESERWGCDGHSHSFFTVAELLAYDWTQVVTQRGTVSAVQFEEWERMKQWHPEPKGWCGDIAGGRIVKVHEAEMRTRVKEIMGDGGFGPEYQARIERLKVEMADVYAQVQWQLPYAATCQDFWFQTIPRLLQVGSQEDVRVVFWFDN